MSVNNLFIITTSLNEEKEISIHIDYLNKLSDEYGIKYVIIDGGSNDDTLPILQSKHYQDNIFISNNCTIYQAWNMGVDCVCKDAYVCFLGVGDRLSEVYIESILLNINQNKYDVLFTHLSTKKNQKLTSEIDSSAMSWTCLPFPHAGAFYYIDLFEKIGKFDEGYKIAGDFEWLLRLNHYARVEKIEIKYKYIKKGYIYMRPGGVSTGESRHISILMRETIRAHLFHKTPISIKRILYFLVMYAKKKLS